MFKTDANGVVGWDTSAPLSAHGRKIYPNPARDYTNILFDKALKEDMELKVYNVLGALVREFIFMRQLVLKGLLLRGSLLGNEFLEKIIFSGQFV